MLSYPYPLLILSSCRIANPLSSIQNQRILIRQILSTRANDIVGEAKALSSRRASGRSDIRGGRRKQVRLQDALSNRCLRALLHVDSLVHESHGVVVPSNLGKVTKSVDGALEGLGPVDEDGATQVRGQSGLIVIVTLEEGVAHVIVEASEAGQRGVLLRMLVERRRG